MPTDRSSSPPPSVPVKKSYEGRYHGTVNLYDIYTLAGAMQESFGRQATQYGLTVEGIEDDINEHMDFWTEVAKDILARLP